MRIKFLNQMKYPRTYFGSTHKMLLSVRNIESSFPPLHRGRNTRNPVQNSKVFLNLTKFSFQLFLVFLIKFRTLRKIF